MDICNIFDEHLWNLSIRSVQFNETLRTGGHWCANVLMSVWADSCLLLWCFFFFFYSSSALTNLLPIGSNLTSTVSDQSQRQNLVGTLRKKKKNPTHNCPQPAQEEYFKPFYGSLFGCEQKYVRKRSITVSVRNARVERSILLSFYLARARELALKLAVCC